MQPLSSGTPRRSLARPLRASALLVLCAMVPVAARAACDAIPSASSRFVADVGAVDRPYAGPGDWVELTLDPACGEPSRFGAIPGKHVAGLVFSPAGGGPRTVVLLVGDPAAAGGVDAVVAACRAAPGVGEVHAIVDPSSFRRRSADEGAGRTLALRFPDTDFMLGGADDDRTLAGPVRMALFAADAAPADCAFATHSCGELRGTDGLLACVDRLSSSIAGCGGSTDLVFPSFTALPPANDYRALCTEPASAPCTGTQDQLRATVDEAGNLLMPMDWRSVLVDRSEVPVARLLRGTATVPAFADRSAPLALRPEQQVALSAHDVRGVRLPPLFEPLLVTGDGGTTLFGTADAPATVLRIASRFGVCDDGGFCTIDSDCSAGSCRDACQAAPASTCDDAACTVPCGRSFDFTDRQAGGVGPILIDVSDPGQVKALDPVPLDGLVQSTLVNSFVLEEAITNQDYNGDGDASDHVATVVDRLRGEQTRIGPRAPEGCWPGPVPAVQPPGRAVARIAQPPFSFPALAVEDEVVAFLEPEPLQFAADQNCNGSVFETILRAYDLDGSDLIGGEPVTADAEPVIDGRSLAISAGRVFYRSDERQARRSRVQRITPRSSRFDGDFMIVSPSISADGRVVAYAANLVGDAAQNLHVYVHDRCVANTEPVVGCTPSAAPDKISNQGPSTQPELSADGRFVAYTSAMRRSAPDRPPNSGPLVKEILLFDRVTRQTERVSVALGGGLSDGDSSSPSLSEDGRYVAFASFAANLVAGDTNVVADVFVRDRCRANGAVVPGCTVATRRVSVASDGTQADFTAQTPRISADGRTVVFRTLAANLVPDTRPLHVLAHDLVTGTTTSIPIWSSGLGDVFAFVRDYGIVDGLALSRDGRFVAVETSFPVLPGDTNGIPDVYVHDRLTGTTERASLDSNGGQLPSSGPYAPGGREPAISAEGRYVGFVADAAGGSQQLLLRDRTTGMTKVAAAPGACRSDDVQFFAGSLAARADAWVFESRRSNGHRDTCVVAVDPPEAGVVDRGPILEVLDAQSGVRTELGPATSASVSSGQVAYLTPSSSGGAPLVALWTGDGPAVSLGRNATSVAMSERWLGALVTDQTPPAPPAATTAHSGVAQYYDLRVGGWRSSGLRATRLGLLGSLSALLTPEWIDGVALNADGDRDDVVLRIVDPSTPSTVLEQPHAATDFVLGGPADDPGREIVAFGVPEEGEGAGSLNWTPENDDGDVEDRVLHVYDAEDGHIINTKQAVTPCRLEACDPRFPYRVLEDTVRFLTFERDQGEDLNGDGDQDDLVVQVFNVREACSKGDPGAGRHTLAATAAGVCTDSGRPCGDDLGCVAPATCFLPPGGCTLTLEQPCNPDDPTTVDASCGENAYCQPIAAGEGVCRRLQGRCRGGPSDGSPCELGSTCPGDATCSADCTSDTECSAQAACVDGGQRFLRLTDPLKPDPDGAGSSVFSSAGRCIERSGTCASNAGCDASFVCDAGTCERDHGACTRDGSCPADLVCRPQLIVQTAVDGDRDELPDVIDNCPQVANVTQPDDDGDGIGNECELPNPLCEAGAEIAGLHVTVSPRAGRNELVVQGRIPVAPGEADRLPDVLRSGMAIAIEELGGPAPRAVLELPGRNASLPADEPGCGPRDGWLASRSGDRLSYANRSGALGPACASGSAGGLSRVVLRRRPRTGGVDLTVRVSLPPDTTLRGPLRVTVALGEDGNGSCAARDLPATACVLRAGGARLVCASR